MFSEVLYRVSFKADKTNNALKSVQKKIVNLKRSVDQNNFSIVSGKNETADVLCKTGQLEDKKDKTTAFKRKIDDSQCFKTVKKGAKIYACVK